ncbi:GTP-binding protein [Polyangium sp. y55x31]|uniref:Rab family GTPase n=1 Tax=Polyangium sp. y55x31 TaxID=3042688 RepID=UPI0024832562|nr:GTP-binding protein [Polyangium sp. y55x31]MDI1480184.1 GTP-binding protein [Polyangium sp. y55x31]
MSTLEKRKVCLLGATGVGKTSLVMRFVRSIFSDQYQTTIGTKIETKHLTYGDHVMVLVIWDLSGEDEFQRVRLSYLRGAAGYLLVADGTRRATVETAMALHHAATEIVGDVPRVLVLNKADLRASWELDDAHERELAARWTVFETSAKTGAGVEEAFRALGQALLQR